MIRLVKCYHFKGITFKSNTSLVSIVKVWDKFKGVVSTLHDREVTPHLFPASTFFFLFLNWTDSIDTALIATPLSFRSVKLYRPYVFSPIVRTHRNKTSFLLLVIIVKHQFMLLDEERSRGGRTGGWWRGGEDRGASTGGGILTEVICERQRLQRVSLSHVGVLLWG